MVGSFDFNKGNREVGPVPVEIIGAPSARRMGLWLE
jgi:hypothetical protein